MSREMIYRNEEETKRKKDKQKYPLIVQTQTEKWEE